MKEQARTHEDLDAMLIGQRTVPKGCQVLNVSPQGMLLQCEPDGRLLTFRDSDLVDIHLTVQHGNGRKKFSIPAIVNRVDIKSIDVVFQHPNTELLKLIEAYRVSDAHMMEASIALSQQESVAKVTPLPHAAATEADSGVDETADRQGGRRVLFPVLVTIILSVCIAAGAYLYTSGIDSRLNVLETITINQTNELAEMRSRIFSSSLQEGRYASLNARLQALTDAFGTLENKLDKVITGKQVVTSETGPEVVATGGTETPISISPERPGSKQAIAAATLQTRAGKTDTGQDIQVDEPLPAPKVPQANIARQATTEETPASTQEPAARPVAAAGPDNTETPAANETEQTRATGSGKMAGDENTPGGDVTESGVAAGTGSGPWIINLLSSHRKRDTDKLAEIAAIHGIPVVQNRAIVKGREYWRLQVTGFENATEAKNYAIPVKKKLGIKDVWIFKQKDG